MCEASDGLMNSLQCSDSYVLQIISRSVIQDFTHRVHSRVCSGSNNRDRMCT